MNDGHQPWFIRYPSLFKQQVELLESAGFKLHKERFDGDRQVVFLGKAKTDPQRNLIVIFPDAFPSAAPKIYDMPGSKLLHRHHRSDTRQLCLFGFNENRWHSGKSVADALAEAEELISNFKDVNSGPDHNQPPEPITQALPYAPNTAILVPPPISAFGKFTDLKSQIGSFAGKYCFSGNPKSETAGRGLILEATFGESKLKVDEPFTSYLDFKGRDIDGDFFYLHEPPTQETLPSILRTCLKQCKLRRRTEYWIALIFKEESGHSNWQRLVWLVARANEHGGFDLIRTFPYVQEETRPRIPSVANLETKRVTLVGCGSLGSKIAANLAASGLSRFNLIDYDYSEPYNAVRHELGVDCFGMNKAKALLHRLTSLNPLAKSNSRYLDFQVASIAPFEQENRFYQMVTESDMIIDATAVDHVSSFINSIACKAHVPAVFASVTNGAWGGEVVRVIPGKTPCWACWDDEFFDKKPPAAAESTGEFFAPGCNQPTFTGTTYDVGFVANLAATMVVETLLQRGVFADPLNNYIRWSRMDNEGHLIFKTEILQTHFSECCPFR